MMQRFGRRFTRLVQHNSATTRTQTTSAHITLPRTEELFLGVRASNGVQSYINNHNYKKILLIASKTLDTSTNEISQIETNLNNSLIASKITGITPHIPVTELFNSIQEARRHNIDCIVVVGGGTNTDTGKLTALFKDETQIQSINDIEKLRAASFDPVTGAHLSSAISATNNKIVPVLLVPTTLSGTTHLASPTANNGEKQLFGHPEMVPRAMIFDPLITKYTPEWLWISTGIRAFDHCIETIMSTYSNPYWDGIASNAMKSLLKYLPLCTYAFKGNKMNDNEFNARLECLVSAYLAVQSVCNGCPMGASHAIGHQLGGVCNVPHGYTSCVMTPYVVKYNIMKDIENKYDCKYKADTIKNIFIDVYGNDKSFDKTKDVANMIHDFIYSLGMPRTLRDVNVTPDKFDLIAKYSAKALWCKTNAVPIKEPQQVIDILNMAQSVDNLKS